MRILLFLLCTVLTVSSASASELKGVAKVLNGYTMEIAGTKVYLWGVNSPNKDEYCRSTKNKKFTCGAAADRTLGVLLQSREISCEEKAKATDGTPLVQCFLDRMDIAEQMVLNGWAVAKTDETTCYAYSQKAARFTKEGMWKSLRFTADQIQGRK